MNQDLMVLNSRDNLPKIKHGAYVINLDEYSDIETHWVALYVQNNNVIYFDSFGVEHKKLKHLLIMMMMIIIIIIIMIIIAIIKKT